jgi:hypothetical protein
MYWSACSSTCDSRQLDEFDRGGRDIETQQGTAITLEQEHFLFPYQQGTPESARPA